MKRFITASFCFAFSMNFAQQKDSILTTISLDPVSIYTEQLKVKQQNPIFQHQDVFQQVNEIKLIKRSSYAIDPSFRANQYEQLNIQFDGGIKAMNACPNRMDPITTHFSANQIQEIEIIKGPYSMRFGPNFGGIINLISHQVSSENGWKNNFSTAYTTNQNAFISHIQTSYVEDKFDIQAGYNYQDYGNYKDGNNREIPSSFRSQDYHLKFGLKTNNKSHYEIGFQQQFGRDISHATLPMDTSYDDTSILFFIGKTMIKNSSLKEVQTRIYNSFVDHQMHNLNRPNAKMMEMISNVKSKTFGAKLEGLWKIKNLNLFTGIDWFYLNRDGDRNGKTIHQNGTLLSNPIYSKSSIWQNTDQSNFGGFIQGQWKLNNSHKIDFGSRLDRNELNIKNPTSTFQEIYSKLDPIDWNWSATINYEYSLNSSNKIKILFGRGVRSGDMIERSINQHQVGMDGASYLGNPSLKPEINHQMEINYQQKINFSNSWLDNFTWNVSIYQSFLKNYIVAKYNKIEINNELKDLKVFTNVKKAYKTGFDLSWLLKINSHFELNGTLNYIYTENKDWKEAIALTPPLENNLTFTFRNKWSNWSLNYQFVNHQNKVAHSFEEKPSNSYNLLHFNSDYIINKNLKLNFTIENIFNTLYQSHLNFNFKNQKDFLITERMTNPGINFKIMLNYQF
ncbi:TonB-dependent receptor domain-containing protein [Empedobacter tilapiae]|uniref:TonB-dependent receptor domain-containing protein n=1 Tax=Empedobacter tilapiae TaxID=2491114 RepID=UPI0028D3C2C7|nr:TonB-dependent receptor [Empedobacter tilapiae]